MKGIVGMVMCDEQGCSTGFMDDSGIRTGHADAVQAGNDAERKAVAEGWSADTRGKTRHYCPNHTQERRLEEERRKAAFEKKA
jgi:hypothetical protein